MQKLFFKRIKLRLFSRQKSALSDKISKDLEKGELVYVNGKPYRKVKIRLVDTWNGNATTYIDRLEHAINEQAGQITELGQRVQQLNTANTAMQQLNINLTHECRKLKVYQTKRLETRLESDKYCSKLITWRILYSTTKKPILMN